jgi:hypothetical protein
METDSLPDTFDLVMVRHVAECNWVEISAWRVVQEMIYS